MATSVTDFAPSQEPPTEKQEGGSLVRQPPRNLEVEAALAG